MKIGKSTNSLMKHIRNDHTISISGSKQKSDLLNMGYYHGYKGYRFVKKGSNRLNLTSFDQITSLYQFDNQMKSLFYPIVMKLETAIKNRVIEVSVEGCIPSFESVYSTKLNYHDDYIIASHPTIQSLSYDDKRKRKASAIKKRIQIKKKFHSDTEYYYNKGHSVICHFVNNNKEIPIWAHFENLTLGNLGDYIACLNISSKYLLCESLGLINLANIGTSQSIIIDHFHYIPTKLLFSLKDLRNSIAHNSIIFDCRFKSTSIHTSIKQKIMREINSSNPIDFETIVDYLILCIIMLKGIKTPKTELRQIIKEFRNNVRLLSNQIPTSQLNKIIDPNWSKKLASLDSYI